MQKVFVVLALLAGGALACSPAQKENIGLLEKFFGITPFYPNGELDTNGYSNEYISASSDLNCNFNTPDSPSQAGEPSPSKVAAVCKWKNMESSDSPALDNEQWYLFTKQDDKPWRRLSPSSGPRNTPKKGDGFALAGGDGKVRLPRLCDQYADQCQDFLSGVQDQDPGSGIDWVQICEDTCSPPPQSVLYSQPLKCLENDALLSFDYWLLSTAGVRVLLLEEGTFNVLYEVPKNDRTKGCTSRSPRDGVCKISIPAQTTPFHLAIHGHDLSSKFVIIDNIEFTGDLGPNCVYSEDPFDFGTTSVALPSRANAGPISVSTDLNSNGGTDSQWSNSGATTATVPFLVHTGPVDANKWEAVTGSTNTPSGDFFMAQGESGNAELMGDVIDCQQGDGLLTFKAWMSEGTTLEVCVVTADTLQPVTSCDPVIRRSANDEYMIPVYGPFDDVRILFRGSDWKDGDGGMVAIDDIEYDADLCVGSPTSAPEDPDKIDQPACNDLTTTFDDQTLATSKWKSYSQPMHDGFQVRNHGIDSEFRPTANTAVQCNNEGDGKCAGLLVSRRNDIAVGVMESADFSLTTDRYLEMKIRRGTWSSMVYLCKNEMPIMDPLTGDIEPIDTVNIMCATLSGPALSYDQYTNGEVNGVMLPKDTTKVYLIFTNPEQSGAEDAGFLVDDIRMLRGSTGDSGRLCAGSR